MGSFILNTVWFLTLGAPLALIFMLAGVFFCCTILGIPLGIVLFKKSMGVAFPFDGTNKWRRTPRSQS